MISRTDRSGFAVWWWTVDRWTLFTVVALIAIGLILACAASPAVGGGFYYAGKQIAFAAIAAAILIGTSSLSLDGLKIVAGAVFFAALAGSALTLVAGDEILGARRWLDFGWITLQPSEFLKPGFAVLAAAVLAGHHPAPVKREWLTLVLVLPAIVILMLQPDVGQTGLLLTLWAALLFLNGISAVWIGALAAGSAGIGGIAYLLFPYIQHRVTQFLSNGGPGYQEGLALKAFAHGGLFGVGPGAGTIKYKLPFAHSDYIYAVAGEEFGLVLCGLIVLLFAVLTVRLLLCASRTRDRFSQLAGAGLAVVLAAQAFINMGVAVDMLPAKGMTLPFISYGGSSLFAVALTVGFALAVTRMRPQVATRDRSIPAHLSGARA